MSGRTASLRDDITAQQDFVRSRAPVYARLLALLEEQLDRGLEARLDEAWAGRQFGAFYERPLLLLAALRDDALREGEAHPLWRAIARRPPDSSSLTPAAVAAAVAPERTHLWQTLASRYVQTNEPSRAVAWLWPAHIARDVSPRPLALFDVGASAGLNLVADRLPARWTRDDGSPLEVAPIPSVVRRVGFDPRPLDPLADEDARWLHACVWPGQLDREARLEEAMDAFRRMQSGPDAPRIETARAREVPDRLPRGDDAPLALVYQTVVRDYLSDDEWEAYHSGMYVWIASRPPGAALWVELEVTEEAARGGPPAAITVHARQDDDVRAFVIAHCEPHPRALTVHADAVTALRRA
ncbi:MAG: DUF2332 family protein, partial [Gemmatimonadota bacterium]